MNAKLEEDYWRSSKLREHNTIMVLAYRWYISRPVNGLVAPEQLNPYPKICACCILPSPSDSASRGVNNLGGGPLGFRKILCWLSCRSSIDPAS